MEGSFQNTTKGERAVTHAPVSWSSIHYSPHGSALALPAGENFLGADFSRADTDLLIETPSGAHFVVENYFTFSYPPALETVHGAILTAELLTTLAGPMAPNMVVQATQPSQSNTLGASIGQVNEAQGLITVTHANGVQDTLSLGASIYQGDVLETGPKANTSIVFVDDTIFTLSSDGRMVMDEMVYDPGEQTGAFNAQIVQGVFSFVSGKIAKTSPDGMVVSTPTSTIGVRGSTILGEAAPDGQANQIILISDIDGNVGELVISNGGGTIVLSQAGASTTIFSATIAPANVTFMSPQDIQQNFGATLTNLVKNVAQKAEQDTKEASRQAQKADQDAEQAQQDAAQAEQDAAQADQQAEKAQGDAEAAKAEAEAAKAEAEILVAEAEAAKVAAKAIGDAEAIAKAEALEAQATEAQQQAEQAQQQADAEGAQAIEAQQQAEDAAQQAQIQGEAAASAQQQAVEAQVQADQTAQYNTMAQSASDTQQQVFTQFMETGFVDPNMAPGMAAPEAMAPSDGEPQSNNGPGESSQGPEDQAIKQAAQDAAEQALAEGATPEEAAAAGFDAAKTQAIAEGATEAEIAAAEQAYNEALAAGLSPEQAMKIAGDAAGQINPEGFPPAPPPPGGAFDPALTDPTFMGDPMLGNAFFDPAQVDVMSYELQQIQLAGLQGDFLDFIYSYDPSAYLANTVIDQFLNTTSVFNEVLAATTGNDNLVGGSGNTQFTMNQGSTLGGTDVVNGGLGTDEITFTSISSFQMVLDMSTKTATYANSGGTITGTVALTSVEQVYASDGSAARQRINMTNSNTGFGYILSGSSGVDTISVADSTTLSYIAAGTNGEVVTASTIVGSIIFGGAGNDTITGSTKGDIIYGGADNDTITGGGGDDDLRGGPGNDTYIFAANDATSALSISISDDGGNDKISVAGDNDFTNSSIYNVETLLWTGAAIIKITGTQISNGLSTFTGDGNLNQLQIYATSNISTTLTTPSSFTAGTDTVKYFGTTGNDTFTGSTFKETIWGGSGGDTLTGGTGADLFVYTSASQSAGASTNVDWIKDFNASTTDNIVLKAITTGTFAFNATLVDTGSNTIAWAGNGNSEAMLDTNGDVTLKIDLNGNGQFDGNDLEIDVTGYTGTFDTTDFTIV